MSELYQVSDALCEISTSSAALLSWKFSHRDTEAQSVKCSAVLVRIGLTHATPALRRHTKRWCYAQKRLFFLLCIEFEEQGDTVGVGAGRLEAVCLVNERV